MVNAATPNLSRMNFKKLHAVFEYAGHLDIDPSVDSVDQLAGFDRLTVYELFKAAALKFGESKARGLEATNPDIIAEQIFNEQVKVNATGTGAIFEDIGNAPNLPNYLVLLFVEAIEDLASKGQETRNVAANHNAKMACRAVQAEVALKIITDDLVDKGTEVRDKLIGCISHNIGGLAHFALRR